MRLRKKIIENIPDVVLCPRSQKDIENIVAYCDENRIPLYVYGGGSTVTRGMEAVKGGVCLDMSVHMNKVVAFNEINQTITVQAGMWGPELERMLNNAPETLAASAATPCGHFPQSFEHSSVGGWVVTRGAGQNSTYYGKIEDMVIAQEYVTPRGIFKTPEYPRCATGPDFDQIMMGSEGTFGVLTNVTLRVCPLHARKHPPFRYLFQNWEDALAACREIMQGEFGLPSVFRLSDPEETDVAMRMYHIHGTPADTAAAHAGLPAHAALPAAGHRRWRTRLSARLVARKVSTICPKHRAFHPDPFQGHPGTGRKAASPTPIMREDLMDYGIIDRYAGMRGDLGADGPGAQRGARFRQTPPAYHLHDASSHAYPQGANLYFIFIARITRDQRISGAAVRHPGRHPKSRRVHEPPPRHWQADRALAGGADRQACMDVIRVLRDTF